MTWFETWHAYGSVLILNKTHKNERFLILTRQNNVFLEQWLALAVTLVFYFFCAILIKPSWEWKRTKKTYSPMDDDERKHNTQSTVSTVKCLRQWNMNKLTQTMDREGRRRKQWGRLCVYWRLIRYRYSPANHTGSNEEYSGILRAS